LQVSRIALGCTSFGVPAERAPWALDEERAGPFFRQALELGITFWDTANRYGNGSSEEIVGRAANADALGNLVRWAATGRPAPMYASPDERAAGIERGARLSAAELDAWLCRSARDLDVAMTALTGAQWTREVVTAQGRTVPATEIAWLRAREICVHTVDLARGIGFGDLPEDFLTALVEDITAKRGTVPAFDGPLPDEAAWLAGRPHSTPGAPALGPWL
jgi:maleylpyruvate isomerase